MTINFYISKSGTAAVDKGFDRSFERLASMRLAKKLYESLAPEPRHYTMLVNVSNPPCDVVILTTTGLGIIDLKDYNTAIRGTHDTEWFTTPIGGHAEIRLSSGSHLNPFQQVKAYRAQVYAKLAQLGSQSLNTSLLKKFDKVQIQGAVVFTGIQFDRSGIKIDPKVSRPWFDLLWLDEVAEWAYSLMFDNGLELTRGEIDWLVTTLFDVEPWVGIDNFLTKRTVHGKLWVVVDGKKSFPYLIDRDKLFLGRSSENELVIPNDFPLVSRRHAQILFVDGDIHIRDANSKHGTYLNGVSVSSFMSKQLHTGDRIVLGRCDEQGNALPNAYTLLFEASSAEPSIAETSIGDLL